MSTYHDAFPSRFLKTTDLTAPVVATIAAVAYADVGSGANAGRKLVVSFQEPHVKPLVLSAKTNCRSIAEIAGTDDYERWTGIRIELYPATTEYQGKRVPCVRIGVPQATTTPRPVGRPAPRTPTPKPSMPVAAEFDSTDVDPNIGF